ncbi:MAG: NAD(P)H-hydrate dehydratase [Aquihabitans sp.]
MEPIVTPSEMAAIDAAAPEPVAELIERAGSAVARTAIRMLGGTYGRRVVVVAGKGNNGADGRAAARRLEARGVRATVIDAADAPGQLPAADLVVDAAYGTGFRGAYEAPAKADPGTPVLAVDIPSGIDGTTGIATGHPLPADRTVTFAAWKPGLLLADGAELAGEVELADIGLDTSRATAWRVTADDLRAWLPDPERATHKWRAAAWLIAGSPGMTGAARLAASSAMRSGAGYLRLSTPGAGTAVDAPVEAVVSPLAESGWADDVLDGLQRFGAVGTGPGLGTDEATADQVRQLVAGASIATIVDGDGLRALGAAAATVVRSRPPGAPLVVLTPHDGEFEALDGGKPDADRFAAVRGLARATGAVVLLKGSTTLVGAPDGPILAIDQGDARLATAGSGDVLTGLILGLLAAGVAPQRAAAAGAFLHGRAGHLAWRRGLVAGDLVDHLPAAFAEVAGGSIATLHPRL